MNTFETINPATEEQLNTYEYYQDSKISHTIDHAHHCWLEWKETSFTERSVLFRKLKDLLEKKKDQLAEEITLEMGKPLDQSVAEIEKCAWVCEYYATNAEAFLQKEVIKSDASKSYVRYDPLGVVLAVMPWNFPYWQVFRFAAPALMAGNACILKHSPNTTACALSIQRIFEEAGFPIYLFNTIIADIPQIEPIVANKKIAAVTLTGSTRAGKSLAALAGKYLKKTVLELGGSDPYLILADADLNLAAETCVTGRLINSGQSCIAAKRFIVVSAIKKPFVEKVKKLMEAKVIGNPTADETDIGPMARKDLMQLLADQVDQSVKEGAEIVLGGKIDQGRGYYYPPTILAHVKPGMPAYDEELFGPVASIIEVKDDEEAIKVANDTIYGLGSAIFTRDLAKAEIMASKIQAGSTFINAFVKSDPRLPFGGIKESGYGRELSFIGIKEFVNAKTVYIR
ncbi:MAG: NAD-dependent succinate-semialdehyde dehydrogenase [Cyclobacteriaceae bacterium]|tara:strand:- start:3601 stop:4968 length:1368 start_codon:yes stop_codon:yes gene_type:complete